MIVGMVVTKVNECDVVIINGMKSYGNRSYTFEMDL